MFKRKLGYVCLFVLLVICCFSLASGGCGGSGDDSTDGTDDETGSDSDPTVLTLENGSFTTATLSQSSIDSDGGTITSTDLTGFQIVVPSEAVDTGEEITFTVSSATISGSSGLPDGTETASQLIRIQASGSDDWNEYRMFDKIVTVTLPYIVPATGEDSVRFYVFNSDGTLEPTGFTEVDTDNNTVTFETRTFADAAENSVLTSLTRDNRSTVTRTSVTYLGYVAIGIGALWTAWLTDGVTIDTGFRASTNGWFIPNYGSYYDESRGGNCFGMVSWAKYYFRKSLGNFYTKYRDDDNTTTWVDDAVAIELASRAHNAEIAIWNDYVTQEINEQLSARKVAMSYVGGMYVTNQPVLLYIKQVVNNMGSGAHAIMIRSAAITSSGVITFGVYDPNHPNSDSRTITYTDGTGFSIYASGTTAASSNFNYNYFKHIGYNVAVSDAAYDNLKESADADFTNSSVFPTITITSITGKNNSEDVMSDTGTTDEGESKYITSDISVIISGTVLGGLAQTDGSVVDNINIVTGGATGNSVITAAVNNIVGGGDGSFQATVPLKQGENEIVFLASANNSLSHWAAFDRQIIESTASRSDMTVTLSWGQDSSDVDMYVKEPDIGSSTGDTIYYQNKRSSGGDNPYQDVDNTSGYGPEHYYAAEGTSTLAGATENPDGLYGIYTVKVHYYADHDDDDETTQPISWNVSWRYLAYCADPCSDPESDGYWVEGSQSGSLSSASSANCCDIDNTGGDWSSSFTIDYEEPDPDNYVVPDPPDVMLP